MIATNNYRQILWQSFSQRKENNKSYSLRAFARDIGISHSRLSLIFSGKQGLSPTKAEQIASRLHLDAKSKEIFCNEVKALDSRSKMNRKDGSIKLQELRNLSFDESILDLDTFSIVADWQNYALLELTRTRDFKSDVLWISKRLQLSVKETESTISRLIRLGLLKVENGIFKDTAENLTTTCEMKSKAIRKFNQQILAKASRAIETQSLEERDFSTITMAVPLNQMEMIKNKIKEFRRSLNSDIEASLQVYPADEVYCLSVQFFSLSTKDSE